MTADNPSLQPKAAFSERERAEFAALGLPSQIALVRTIGKGGMGEVYEVRHPAIDNNLAVKVLQSSYARDKDSVERFVREGETLFQLSDPRIVQVHECGTTSGGLPYLLMDFVPGITLDKCLEVGALPHKQVLEIALQCAQALAHAHKVGVVHRDLKPSNIALSTNSQEEICVKLLDFGIAKWFSARAKDNRLTATGEVVGTPFYMSPEQCLGEEVDGRSDVYSLGCLVYEALTGSPPFTGADAVKIMAQQAHDPLPDVGKVRPDLPADMAHVVMRMTEKRYQDRYQSMQALVADLERVKAGQKIATSLTGKQKRTLRSIASVIIWGAMGFAVAYGLNTLAQVLNK